MRQPLTGFDSLSGSSPVSTELPLLAGLVTLSGVAGGRDSSFVVVKSMGSLHQRHTPPHLKHLSSMVAVADHPAINPCLCTSPQPSPGWQQFYFLNCNFNGVQSGLKMKNALRHGSTKSSPNSSGTQK